jgi:hypothetical protein
MFELYCWQFSNTGCFHNMLFDLIQKADLSNRRLLSKAFPEEVEAFEIYQHKGDSWLREKGNSFQSDE